MGVVFALQCKNNEWIRWVQLMAGYKSRKAI